MRAHYLGHISAEEFRARRRFSFREGKVYHIPPKETAIQKLRRMWATGLGAVPPFTINSVGFRQYAICDGCEELTQGSYCICEVAPGKRGALCYGCHEKRKASA